MLLIVSLSNRIIQDIAEWTILPEQQLTSMPDSKPGVGLVLPPSDNHSNEGILYAYKTQTKSS
jgi:hypothetical protein